jgi:hypothetical protein
MLNMLIRLLALGAVFTIAVISATAQETELNTAAERTAACLKVEDAGERLACFEEAAQGLSSALETQTPAAPLPPQPTGTPAAEVTANSASAADASQQQSAEGATTEGELPEWAAAPEPKPAPAPRATAESDAGDSDLPIWARVFSREDDADKPDAINVSVVRILRNNAGRHFFIMADGQEWEQTMADPVRPPSSLPAEATIEEALIGNPRLTFDEGPSGAYKVRRTK